MGTIFFVYNSKKIWHKLKDLLTFLIEMEIFLYCSIG